MELRLIDLLMSHKAGEIDLAHTYLEINRLFHQNNWIRYDWGRLETRPKEYGKYFVRRKDSKVHWETWNSSGWAYNGCVITHWMEVYYPAD